MLTSEGSEPQTWHYGVVAKWWAEFNKDGGRELEYFRPFLEAGQPRSTWAAGRAGCSSHT